MKQSKWLKIPVAAALVLAAAVNGANSATTFPNQAVLWSMDQTGGFGNQVAAAPNIVAVLGSSGSFYTPTVFVYQKLNGTWTETAELTESDASSYASTPAAVSMAMSSTGNTIVIGIDTFTTSTGSPASGTVYVFQQPPSGWHDMNETARLTLSSSTGCRLGDNVAADDTYVAASYLSICPVPNNQYANFGVAIFQKPATGWVTTSNLQATIPDYVGNETYGESGLDISNGWVAACTGPPAGPPSDDAVVLAPAQTGGNPANPIRIDPPQGLSPASWCTPMALFGNSFAIGSLGLGNGSIPQGLFVYAEPASGWQTTNSPSATLNPSNSDTLGNLLAMSSNLIAASSLALNTIYVFEKPASGWANAGETLDIVPPTPSQTLNVMTALAATDSFIAVGEDEQTCPPPIANSGCSSVVYVYDSNPVAPAADPVVKLVLNGKAAITGQPFNLTATVTNQSTTAEADNLQLTLPLAAGISQVQVDSSQGDCQLQNTSVLCNLGTLAATTSATVTISAVAPQTSQTLNLSATVTTTSPVRSLLDNQGSVNFFVDAPPVASNIHFDVSAGGGVNVPFMATDTNGNSLMYRIVTEPNHGTLMAGGVAYTGGYSGGYTYLTDNKTYTGPDSFTYVANDGYTDSNVATASVTVQAPPPPPSSPGNPTPNNPLLKAAAGALNPFILLLLGVVFIFAKRRQYRS